MKKYTLELVVFLCGASVMILELVGSRILAPFVGISIVTWTSLIGIILASLSLGYHKGGALADRTPSKEKLSRIIFFASLSTVAVVALRIPVFMVLGSLDPDLTTKAVVSALILFALPGFLMGMVSPFAVRLKVDSVKKTGGIAGNLYAISTVGSIAGTFLTGFYLISTFTTIQILIGIGCILMLCVILLTEAKKSNLLIMIAIFLLAAFTAFLVDRSARPEGVLSFDTTYNSVSVYETLSDGKKIRVMSLDGKFDSAMFLDSEELVFDYSKYYNLAEGFTPELKNILVLGGAGYSTPKDLLKRYPEANVDVVEIDPALTELARKYFELPDNPRLSIYHEDGRTFINRFSKTTPGRYDTIFLDVFRGYSLPYQMTTRESMQGVSDLLTDEGVMIANVISGIEGDKGRFIRSEYHTLKTIFPHVYIIPVGSLSDGSEIQNVMVVAFKSQNPAIYFNDPVLSSYFKNRWLPAIPRDMPILTDNFAPVDQYMLDTLY